MFCRCERPPRQRQRPACPSGYRYHIRFRKCTGTQTHISNRFFYNYTIYKYVYINCKNLKYLYLFDSMYCFGFRNIIFLICVYFSRLYHNIICRICRTPLLTTISDIFIFSELSRTISNFLRLTDCSMFHINFFRKCLGELCCLCQF